MVKIQIVSDIHLEFRNYNFGKIIKPSAPILCLLGDICVCGTKDDWEKYKNFIKNLSPLFKYIIHVPGNHEYYTNNRNITTEDTIQGIDNKLKRFSKAIPNLFFLNNTTLKLNINNKSYVFIGSTLWTHVEQKNRKYVENRMNDYSMIHFNNSKPKNPTDILTWKPTKKYTVDDMSKLHKKSVRYIIKELKNTKPRDIVIILTHHKMYKSKPPTDILSQAYESDLFTSVIKPQPNLKLIAYGHTHVRDDRLISRTRIVSNPKGYPNEPTKFNDAFVVQL